MGRHSRYKNLVGTNGNFNHQDTNYQEDTTDEEDIVQSDGDGLIQEFALPISSKASRTNKSLKVFPINKV